MKETVENGRNGKFTKFIFFLIIIVTLFFIARHFGMDQILNPEIIKTKVIELGPMAPFAFILIYVIVTVFMLPASALTVAGGAAFGSIMGTIYTVIGATIGATISFLITRYFGAAFVEKYLKQNFETLYEYDEKIEKHGFWVTLFLRFIPIVPFTVLNYGMGLTKVRFRHYLIATFLGIIPGTFIYSYFGNSLTSMNITHIAIAIVLLILLASILPIFNHCKKKKYFGLK